MPGKIDTPLNKILEQVEWGNFRLWNLFIKKTIKWVPKNEENLDENPAWYHMFGQNIKYQYPQKILLDPKYLQEVDSEYPILWYTSSVGEIWIITESFYRSGNNWAFQWLFPKSHKYTKKQLLFILSILQKKFISFWYDTGMANILDLEFELPIKNNEIDYEIMDKFVAELEKNYLKEGEYLSDREINAYLQVTWLKDYELTSDELNLLKDFEDGKFEWKEFKIWWDNGLFMINSSKKKFDANKVNILDYWKPYVVRTANNNWLRWYLDEDEQFLNDWNTISFGQDTATMFYQEKPYFTWDKIKVIKSKDNKFDKSNTHFFITSMWKAFSSFARWQSSFNVKIIENQDIYLPAKDNKPDYELMKTFISAVQKLVIKDVVKYNEERLKATTEIINKIN